MNIKEMPKLTLKPVISLSRPRRSSFLRLFLGLCNKQNIKKTNVGRNSQRENLGVEFDLVLVTASVHATPRSPCLSHLFVLKRVFPPSTTMTALMSSAFVDNAGAQAHTPSSPTVTTYTPTHMYPPRTSSVRNHLASGYEAAPTGPSLEPPPGMTYAQFVNSWMDAHIARWLADAKCAHLASAFQTNDIRGDVLLELDQPTLKEMGITSIGDRVRIINAVKILRQKCSSSRTSLGSTPAPDSNRAGSHSRTGSSGNKLDASAGRTRRPAPLNISQTIGQQDLPRIVHNDGQDSARPRLLQQPTPNTAGPSSAQLSAVPTPGSTTPYAANADRNKPQLSRIAPLMTPGSRTPASARKYQIPAAADMYANAPLPMPPAGACALSYPHYRIF